MNGLNLSAACLVLSVAVSVLIYEVAVCTLTDELMWIYLLLCCYTEFRGDYAVSIALCPVTNPATATVCLHICSFVCLFY